MSTKTTYELVVTSVTREVSRVKVYIVVFTHREVHGGVPTYRHKEFHTRFLVVVVFVDPLNTCFV